MIVVDTNVIAYLFLPGTFTENSEALFRSDPQWAVPYLWRSEFRNILATYVRAQKLGKESSHEIYLGAENMLRGREFAVNGDHVLELAFLTKLSGYDCEFMALAEQLNCPLVTSDKKLLKSSKGYGKNLSDFI